MKYQKFVKFSIIAFIALGTALLILPKQWSHTVYHPFYLGIMFLVSAILIYLPHLIFKSDTQEEKNLAKKIQAAIAAAFILNGLGELGLYQLYRVGFEYDKLAHLINSMLFAIVLGKILNARKKLSFRQTAWRIVSIIFIIGIGWELWEATSDIFFHTQEWGSYGRHNITDSLGDIMWNCIGITLGIILFKK